MDKQVFLEKSTIALSQVYDTINNLTNLKLNQLNPSKTVLVILDVINGFVKQGALYSPRNEALIKPISELCKKCKLIGISKLAFADTHNKDCMEFYSYPPHCIEGTSECNVVAEISDYILIAKNSTNGFLEEKFQNWLKSNTNIDTFILVGDCSDICVYQFATTLKAYFNNINTKSRIIVPEKLVNTFDNDTHQGDLMQYISLFSMSNNGIELVNNII